MNLLRTIFMIPVACVILGNQSYAMDMDRADLNKYVPTLQELLAMELGLFDCYLLLIRDHGSRDEKIFFSVLTEVRYRDMGLNGDPMEWFSRNVPRTVKEDRRKLLKIIDTLFEKSFVIKKNQLNFNFKKSLKKLLDSTLSSASSFSSDTEIDKDLENDKSENLENDNPVNSKFSFIIQTLRNNTKLVLGGTVLCVAVLSSCVYLLYKNKTKIKKEDDKKEDNEEKDGLQKEENIVEA